MVGGLEHLFTGFSVQQNEADTLSLITSTLCVHIEEFDRTHKQDTGLIKTIITGESFTFRGAYERKAERRKNRASFIGSCNTADLLREPGANRRFIILPVKSIGRKYPLGESKQVLAEMRHWNTKGFKMSLETQEAIKAVNADLSPYDVEEEVIAIYNELISKDTFIFWELHQGHYSALSSKMGDIWKDLAKETGHTVQTCRNIVKRKGYGIKTNKGMLYFKERFSKFGRKVEESAPEN
jgi:predicted P-loop ATPase